jgi:NADPH:quinone reductase
MHGVVVRDLVGLAGLEVRSDLPSPSPQAGCVVVDVHAAGLNFPDLLMTEGKYQHRAEPPYVPGLEGAGVVVACGPDVAGEHMGRRVMFGASGSMAQRVMVAVNDLLDVPPGWSWAEAAGFPVVGKTAYHALVHRAALRAGETLLVHGASGGTGHMAVKLGKALGARVVATGRDADKLKRVLNLGADATVVVEGDALVAQIKAAAGPGGIAVVFDPVGGEVFEASLKAASFGARVLIIGFTANVPNAVRTNYALIKGLSILGVRAGEAARHDPAVAADYRTVLPGLAAAHDLKPLIDRIVPLDRAVEAFQHLASGGVVGKVVVALTQHDRRDQVFGIG